MQNQVFDFGKSYSDLFLWIFNFNAHFCIDSLQNRFDCLCFFRKFIFNFSQLSFKRVHLFRKRCKLFWQRIKFVLNFSHFLDFFWSISLLLPWLIYFDLNKIVKKVVAQLFFNSFHLGRCHPMILHFIDLLLHFKHVIMVLLNSLIKLLNCHVTICNTVQ